MKDEAIRRKIRQRLEGGALPRQLPAMTTGPGQALPDVNFSVDAAIGITKCSGCDGPRAQIAYRYLDGTIIRFHGQCHRIWDEERKKPSQSAA